MRNLLFIHHSNDLYGADVILLEMLRQLDRSRFNVLVLLPEDSRHIGRLAPKLEECGAEVIFLPLAIMRRKYFRPAAIFSYFFEMNGAITAIRKLIRERHIDLVHTNTVAVTAGPLAAKFSKTPLVWHVHEILVDPVFLRKLLHWLVARCATKVVCISEAVRRHLLDDQPLLATKTVVIPNGLKLARFIAPKPNSNLLRSQYGVPENALLVGMIGRVTRWKGQLVLAEAARKLIEKDPKVHFMAVGGVFDTEHHYMEHFKAEVLRLGIEDRFHIVDYTPDISGILASYDIFVLPSTLPEPFGLVLIEAMASGKPVIATRHGGPLEIISEGVTGLLIQPGDPDALASAIDRLLSDPEARFRLGKAARIEAIERFSIERYTEDFEGLYESLCVSS